MSEPVKDAQGSQSDKGANIPAKTAPDEPTTTQPRAQEPRNLMDHLGIPSDVQKQIKPKTVEEMKGDIPSHHPKAEQQPAERPPAEPEKPEKPAAKPQPQTQQEHEPDEDETEQEPEHELEQEHDTEQPKQDKREKRIKRLTRQKYELEGQVDQLLGKNKDLEDRLAKLEAKGGEPEKVPSESGRLAHITNLKQLNQEADRARGIVLWCAENPDGAETSDGKFISPKEVAKWKTEAELTLIDAQTRKDELEKHAARQTEFKKLAGQYDTLAKQAWPEMFDSKTEDYQIAQQVLGNNPELKARPDKNYALGLILEGMKSLHGRIQAAAKDVAARENGNGEKPRRDISPRAFEPRVPLAPVGPEAPTREVVPSSHKKLNEAMTQLVADPDGSVASLTNVFSALRQTQKRPGGRAPVTV